MIKHIKGDIFKQGLQVICHQTNCMGVMGGGVAYTVHQLYPEVFKEYYNITNPKLKNDRENLLGTIQIVETHTGIMIVNMFAQYSFGSDRCYTQYGKFEECCYAIYKHCIENNITEIGMPFKIGCDRAGGDWNRVYDILETYFGEKSNITLVLCEYDPNK